MSKLTKLFEQDNNNSQIQEIKKTMKQTKEKRMYLRYLVIYYHLKEYTIVDISKIVDPCEHTVGSYIKKYNSQGIEGLVPGCSPGAPRKLTQEQEQLLKEIIITKTPDEVGFPSRKNWDLNIARQWIQKKFGVEYSLRGMLEVLHHLNLSYTRPTYTLAKADPEKQEIFKQEFELLKKAD
ncbi:putative transposase [Marinisporobacter balticus]|uniref:Putative transposase n=1 Tax=Marinisporobacter balticus TaxID=2018667 RepID=A0A4R2KSH7_9FIRM|nr:putative transposase [Marinisporobacter balticus]